METLQELGIVIIQQLQGLSPALDGLMKFFTFLGKLEFYLLMMPFIYLSIDRRLGFRTLLILLITNFWASFFKLLFHQPRPYWIGGVKQLATETSYGFPSSHASDTFAVWGFLAYQVKRTWMWLLSLFLILFIAISRLYLGVHFLHDILFGWLIGFIIVVIFLLVDKPVSAWAKELTLSMQILLALLISIVIILIGQVIQSWLSGISDPEPWASFAVKARIGDYSFNLAGALFGAIAGYALMRQYACFTNSDKWINRILCYAIGLIGVVVFYFGLDMSFGMITSDETIFGQILRTVRYGSVVFWVVFLAPWLFLKIKLAEIDKST